MSDIVERVKKVIVDQLGVKESLKISVQILLILLNS